VTLHNDLACLRSKIKSGKNELCASVVIPFHTGYDLLENTVASLTQQSYPKDLFEVIIVADANYSDAELISDRYNKHLVIKLVTLFNKFEKCGNTSRKR
jgi:cellulose synthase/poly-beta-1,6-N-acetylglucosamine synthase-like glycosyltransferase